AECGELLFELANLWSEEVGAVVERSPHRGLDTITDASLLRREVDEGDRFLHAGIVPDIR
ncbi:hypothetical protein AB4144_48135, partial [Rhizobiaceae sp. 2RAB30]